MKRRLDTTRALGAALLATTLWLGLGGAMCRAQTASEVLTLADALQEALSNDHLIKEARQLERAAAEGLLGAKAALLPSLSAHYEYFRLDDNPYAIFKTELGTQKVEVGHHDNFTWDLTLTQPIFTGFALVTKKKIAALDVARAQVQKEQAVLDVAKRVKTAYFRVLLAGRFLDVAREEENQLAAHLRDAQKFYKQGLIAYNDVLKSQVALAQARQTKVRRAKDVEVATADLNRLLGRPLTAPTRVADVVRFSPGSYELESLMEEAVRNRPELRVLRLAVKQAQEGVRLAASEFYPKVFLVGRVERTGKDPLGEENDYQNPDTTTVGVRLEWPFFEWGRTQAAVRQQRAKARSLQERLADIEESVRLEVKAALSDLEVAQANVETAKTALEQARENLRITRLQYRQQVTTATEVLDARAYLTQAEANYYGAHYGWHLARAELDRALGRR
ncbi:Outer membrane protein TolC [Desulfacinum hydrothermale DSM 13146]|uniref:Outer membrane protein TolC n=1 Tax=Desulfacinum hydrothermale DSM 13146 TaxID=1121390 RepID=A0A1W1X8V9_9BACT|nr:TolC family protein [Desulfacinum hydrothermale]SMC20270.1 Outer membrane protein TolC [Desulfacinum hydrothermale DSM 13146]